MARERRESRLEWSKRLSRFKRSGLAAEEFCLREGVSRGQLAWWKGRLRRLGRTAAVPTAPTFVELVSATAVGIGVELVLRSGALVRVPVGFDEATVTRLVRALDGAAP